MTLNSKAPDFALDGSDGKKHNLKEFSGGYLVLYFYPRDDTPGCTLEAKGFSSKIAQIRKLGALELRVNNTNTYNFISNKIKKLITHIVLLNLEMIPWPRLSTE